MIEWRTSRVMMKDQRREGEENPLDSIVPKIEKRDRGKERKLLGTNC